MNSKVSIVIPVYNVDLWLRKCIDSVLCQSYRNLEILLINDGSTDKSGIICDEYKQIDNRITVIHNSNLGLSYSRNVGIKKSTGNYIMFLDSDDYIIDKAVISKFVKIFEVEKSDFIYTSYCRFNDGEDYRIIENLDINIETKDVIEKSGVEILALLIEKGSYHHAAYLKICSRKFLMENNLFFKEGIYHEDADWTPRLYLWTNKISIYNEAYYMRRMRADSIITTTNEKSITKKICDRLIVAKELVELYRNVDECNEKRIIINDFIRMYWGDLLTVVKIKDKNNRDKVNEVVKETILTLNKSSKLKYLIVSILIKLIGINNFTSLIKCKVK